MLLLVVLILFPIHSFAESAGVKTLHLSHPLHIDPDHSLRILLQNFASNQPIADLALSQLLAEPGINLIQVGNWLENMAVALAPDLAQISDQDIAGFVACARPIVDYMATNGISYRRLSKILPMFEARLNLDKSQDADNSKNVSPPQQFTGYLRQAVNELIIRKQGNDDLEVSDLFRLRYDGHNQDWGFTWHLSLLNPDSSSRHYSYQAPLEYDEPVDEAYLSFTLHRFPFTRIDMGRFPEEILGGSLFRGSADGIRGRFERGPWYLQLAGEFLEPRWRKTGFNQMNLPAPDSGYAVFGREINHGQIEAGGFTADLSGPVNGGGNWIGYKSLKTPTVIAAAPFTSLWLQGKKTFNRHTNVRGFIEQQDMEDWSAGGVMNRSFEGQQLALDLEYDPLGEARIFLQVRLREIDHIQLGWNDDLTIPDTLRSFRWSRTGRGSLIQEHLNNSEFTCIGIERLVRLKPLHNPFLLRLWLESLSGWKDLDTVTPFRQDNVFDQNAAAALVEYKTPGDWTWRLRLRGVQYRQDDWDYATQAKFLPGSVPRDRVEFDLRIISPAF